MKKKILLIVLLSMLCMGAVSAAGLYGTFEGYQIVRVQSNGQTIAAEDVPAVNLNGRTMVPIYMLKELGVNVQWDGTTETVNVALPQSNTVLEKASVLPEISSFTASSKNALINESIYLSSYEVVLDEYGKFIRAKYEVTGLSDNEYIENLALIASTSTTMVYPVDEIIIEILGNNVTTGSVRISNFDTMQFLDGTINFDEYITRWNVTIYNNSNTSMPPSSNQDDYQTEINKSACENLEDDYEREKANFIADATSRGMGNSSYVETQIRILEEELEEQLELYGCD